ncbi:MAG: hypothetical protein PWP31_922 [Clostridia bacterium]|nr:hypothetical protein [Clostridia bacterium]
MLLDSFIGNEDDSELICLVTGGVKTLKSYKEHGASIKDDPDWFYNLPFYYETDNKTPNK